MTPLLLRRGNQAEAAVPAVVRGISRARFVSQMGNEVSLLAFPLLLITERSASLVPLLYAVEYLPFLLLAPFVGHIADTFNRLKLMAAADTARMTVALAVVLGVHLHLLHSWMILFGVGLGGMFTALDEASGQAAIAEAAGSGLRQAMSRLQVALSLAGVVGPAVGAAVITAFRPTGGILLDAITYGASALLIGSTMIRDGAAKPANQAESSTRRQIFGSEAVAGFRFVLSHRHLRTLLSLAAGLAAFSALGYGVMLVYLSRTLHLTALDIGWIMAATAGGTVLGGRCANRIIGRIGEGAAAVSMLCAICLCVAVAPLVTRGSLAVVIVALSRFGAGFSMSIWRVVAGTVGQRTTPDDLRGRVEAAMGAGLYGALPVGYLAGAILLHIADPRLVLWTAVIGFSSVVLLNAPGLHANLKDLSSVPQSPIVLEEAT